jgi:uncharacterized protein YbcV (DUF1398 family)
MDQNLLHDCLHSALNGNMSFPETVVKMAATGVERYYADLVALEKLHYSTDGEMHRENIPLEQAPAIGRDFSESEVKSALVDVQQGRIGYAEFLRRIMRAGTTDYAVYIAGKKAIYHGRNGDFYVEKFPAAKP